MTEHHHDTPASPNPLWPRLLERMENEGPKAVIGLIMGHADPVERRELFKAAASEFSSREWKGKNLDAIISVAQAGIWECLQQADVVASEACGKLLDEANVLSYNLAATLAPCWPGDTLPREQRHFEAGRSAAEDCLKWRAQLKKGPMSVALAHWARGIHLNALGRHGMALAAHESAFHRAEAAAVAEGKPARVGWNAHWLVLLTAGYVELAKRLNGSHDIGPFEKVLRLIEEGAQARPEEADDLRYCADQLREAERRLITR